MKDEVWRKGVILINDYTFAKGRSVRIGISFPSVLALLSTPLMASNGSAVIEGDCYGNRLAALGSQNLS